MSMGEHTAHNTGRTEHSPHAASMEQIIQMLERGVEAILTSEGYQEYLAAMSRFHSYSFNNVALIWTRVPRQ